MCVRDVTRAAVLHGIRAGRWVPVLINWVPDRLEAQSIALRGSP